MSEIDLLLFEDKVYSQNGEDGITNKLIELIYTNKLNKYFVEFGVQNGSECNTRILREKYNWNGLLMDGSYENDNINLKKEWINRENIISLFKKYNVPENINLLSIDIDFNDFYCLKEILPLYKCDIIICEYNAKHLPNEDKVIIYDKNGSWDHSDYFGVSLLTLTKLANYYNYSLISCCSRGVNAFFINNDIIKNKNLNFKNINNVSKIYKPMSRSVLSWLKKDSKNRKYITFKEAMN